MTSAQCSAQDSVGLHCYVPADEHGDRHININGTWADGESLPLYLLVLTECDYTTVDGPMSRAEALQAFRGLARYTNPLQGGRLRVMTEEAYEQASAAPISGGVS